MADSQGLFDALAGAGGANINRPQLNASIANSQAINGLRSAQTEDALMKAQELSEQSTARGKLEDAMGKLFGPNEQSKAHAATVLMLSGFGDAKTALQGLNELQTNQANTTLGDPNQLGSPAQTAAAQVRSGKLAPLETVPNNFAVAPGAPQPNVQQSPQGAAQTNLINAQATHPDLFHPGGRNGAPLDPVLAQEAAEFIRQNPNLAGNFRSLLSNGGPDVIHAFLHPSNTAPSAPPNGITPAVGVSLKEQADIRKDFASGLGAKQTTALNTMVQHSQLFDAVADQLGNGNFAPTNYINQIWQRTFGSPAPTNLAIAGSFLGREAVRATINAGAGTGQERELAVNEHSSPDALHGAAQTLRSLAAGQLHSLDRRAQRGGVDIAQLLGPEAQAAFGRRPVAVSQPPEPNASPAAAPASSPTPLGSTVPELPAGLTLVN